MSDRTVDVETLYHEINEHLFDGSLPADFRIEFVPITELQPDYEDEGGRREAESLQ